MKKDELGYNVGVGNLVCTWELAFLLAVALEISYTSDFTSFAKLKNLQNQPFNCNSNLAW